MGTGYIRPQRILERLFMADGGRETANIGARN